MAYWGYHFIGNVGNCDPTAIDDHETIYSFTKYLVEAIDMVAFGEPFIERFAEHDADKAGYSLCQMIQTSNIAAHFVPHYGEMYLDVFSCKPFDTQTVVDVVKKFFGADANVQVNFLTRSVRQ